jgi:Outer membrane protein beta-barrel domain
LSSSSTSTAKKYLVFHFALFYYSLAAWRLLFCHLFPYWRNIWPIFEYGIYQAFDRAGIFHCFPLTKTTKMKKLFFAIALIAIITSSLKAQEKTSFGIRAGITSFKQNVSAGGLNITTDSRIGFYGGLFVNLGVSRKFAFEPGLLYSQLSSQITVAGSDITDNFSYLALPVLAKYMNEGFSIVAGPQVSFLLSAKEKIGSVTQDFKNQVESTEISAVFGAGYTFASGIGFDGRYQVGLTDINKDRSNDSKDKLNGFTVGLHFRFRK